jgi:hypothetical protein
MNVLYGSCLMSMKHDVEPQYQCPIICFLAPHIVAASASRPAECSAAETPTPYRKYPPRSLNPAEHLQQSSRLVKRIAPPCQLPACISCFRSLDLRYLHPARVSVYYDSVRVTGIVAPMNAQKHAGQGILPHRVIQRREKPADERANGAL